MKRLITLCGALSLLGAASQAASISYSTIAPTPGTYDIYSMIGAANDAANVNDGGTYTDGAGNDAFTYVAFDRGAQGQTFTTGAALSQYLITAVWLEHVGYTANTDLTWYMVPAGSQFQIRITDPSLNGSAGFVLDSELAATTGLEPNTLPPGITSTPNGTGTWLRFGLANPVVLNANTTYGFDVSSPASFGQFGVQPFFEALGTSSDAFAGGAAYTSGPNGSGGNDVLTADVGDRVFLVELTAVPEPSSLALWSILGLAGFVCRRIKG